ncbi:helix-turn-helix domain-containing protein [Corynebacterium vitaeruminis]|uniref:helix-turn-helix domain-containing protein n=1 Tax=Corynebacterium vitaeruminis TaxID=38305 RepID=UPI0012DBD569|nr:helix-turn-helix transcriptional regulator [Corynebacterium vitaeruminis]
MAIADPQWASYGHGLGVRIREIRNQRGLSQMRLADLAGVSRTTISNIERNETNDGKFASPTIQTIYSIARALHVPPAALLPGVGEQVGDRYVGNPKELPIDFRWPNDPTDFMAFESRYRIAGHVTDNPRFDSTQRLLLEDSGRGELPLTAGDDAGEAE